MSTIAVLGLGLMGASFAAALHDADESLDILGWDAQAYPLARALERGHISRAAASLEDALREADVLVLAMYVRGILDLLALAGPLLKPGALVLDLGSTKARIVQAMNALPDSVQAIGGHPMTGRSTAGVDGADARLYRGQVFVLTPTQRSTPETLERATEIVRRVGAEPLVMDAERHDRLVAIISHLNRLLPIAIMQTARSEADDALWTLAAGSFREATRSVVQPLGFWADVFETNAAPITRTVRRLIQQLEDLSRAIERGDMAAIERADEQSRLDWLRRYGQLPAQQHPAPEDEIQMKRVAYLGIPGSYSEMAARKHFGDAIEHVGCQSFGEIFEKLREGQVDHGVLPIENSLAGTVAQSYELLTEHEVAIQGEVILHIEHALMALPGTKLEEIKEVRSHPQALAQCSEFIKRHRMAIAAASSTANSARDLVENPAPGVGVIASPEVAPLYGLVVLSHQIQDVFNNYTRFFVLGREAVPPAERNKTSLIFITQHRPGALVACLTAFSSRGINLTKLESRPLRDRPWEYVFYLDFEGHQADAPFRAAFEELQQHTLMLRVLGSYPAASMPISAAPQSSR